MLAGEKEQWRVRFLRSLTDGEMKQFVAKYGSLHEAIANIGYGY